jgi:hypothetical protein
MVSSRRNEHAYIETEPLGSGWATADEALMTVGLSRSNQKEIRERELAQYIADMLLEMRNMAKSAGLPTLLGLLEITYCEAFSIANKVELPEGEVEKLMQLAKASSGGK